MALRFLARSGQPIRTALGQATASKQCLLVPATNSHQVAWMSQEKSWTEPAIQTKVLKLFTEHSPTDKPVQLESRMREDLGLDSLDTVEIVMAIEDSFGIEITDKEMEVVMTPGDAVAIVLKKT